MNRMDVASTRNMKAQIRGSRLKESSGFTLLELVLATMISALVMGILATALSFTMRLWERQMNQKTSDMPALLELMKWQLANFDPVPVSTGEGNEKRILFIGEEHSLVFATDRSVKALSKGAPIIARYLYSQTEKKLYYAERPLDPYHPDDIKQFLAMGPGDEKLWPRFFPTDVADFAIAYTGGEENSERAGAWDDEELIPAMVMVQWSPGEGAGSFTQVMAPNFLFAASKEAGQKARNAGRGSSNTRDSSNDEDTEE